MQTGHELNCSSKDNERINTASVPKGESERDREREKEGASEFNEFKVLLSLFTSVPSPPVIRFELV